METATTEQYVRSSVTGRLHKASAITGGLTKCRRRILAGERVPRGEEAQAMEDAHLICMMCFPLREILSVSGSKAES